MQNIILILLTHRLIAFVSGCVEGYLDYQKDAKSKSLNRLQGKKVVSVIKHKKSFVWRLVAAVPFYFGLSYLFFLQVGRFDWQTVFYTCLVFVSGGMLYAVGLNTTFNQLAGQKPNYLGAATFDQLIKKSFGDRWLSAFLLLSVIFFLFELNLYLVNA